MIGGAGDRVKIDESKFYKRIYEIRRVVRGSWIVGMIDFETREVFFAEIFHRNAETLGDIIRNHIREGTEPFSDFWRGCTDLKQYNFAHYSLNYICSLGV